MRDVQSSYEYKSIDCNCLCVKIDFLVLHSRSDQTHIDQWLSI